MRNSSISSIRGTKLSSASFLSTLDAVFKSSKKVALCFWTKSKTSTVTEPSDIILTRASSNDLAWNNFSWPAGESMPLLPDSSPVEWNNQLQRTLYKVLGIEIKIFSSVWEALIHIALIDRSHIYFPLFLILYLFCSHNEAITLKPTETFVSWIHCSMIHECSELCKYAPIDFELSV